VSASRILRRNSRDAICRLGAKPSPSPRPSRGLPGALGLAGTLAGGSSPRECVCGGAVGANTTVGQSANSRAKKNGSSDGDVQN
jgi:hypothetical protein